MGELINVLSANVGQPMNFDQAQYDIRCEWGLPGAEILAPICDAIIVVDVLSFSTAVSIAVSRGASVFPYRWKDESRVRYAESVNAKLAGPRGAGEYSLSPLSLITLEAGDRIVLPSPNGATISLATGKTPSFAGCIRNAGAVALAASRIGRRIGVVPCGERWSADDSLRPALEDLIGAGAIIEHLPGRRSPESEIARSAFAACQNSLRTTLENCSSGRELIDVDHQRDVVLSAGLNSDPVAPILKGGAYVAVVK